MTLATVAAVVRYPVKSMAGEALTSAEVNQRGLDGDRSWSVYTADGGIGSGKTTRRFRRIESLLQFGAVLSAGEPPTVLTPDGAILRAGTAEADSALSGLLGQPVALRPEAAVRHHDESALHLLATSSVAALSGALGVGQGVGRGVGVDWRRFRPSLLLDAGPDSTSGTTSSTSLDDLVEDSWIGRGLAIGDELVVRVTGRMQRCVVVGMAQRDLTDGLGDDPRVLRALRERPELGFGVKADVVRPGTVRVGDAVRFSGSARDR